MGRFSDAQARWHGSFVPLLAGIVLLLFVDPFVRQIWPDRGTLVFDLTMNLVLIAGLAAIARTRGHVGLGVALAATAVAAGWLARGFDNPALAAVGFVAGFGYVIFVAALALRGVIGSERVTGDTILGAICAYLLIGIAWAFLYALHELAWPGSILDRGAALDINTGVDRLAYYSFVTLSTLGYGDVVPVASSARSLAVVEAIVGQLYLAILVAALVGRSLAARRAD